MAADAWVVHDKIKEYIGDGSTDLDTHTFNIILCLSTSNIATTSVDDYGSVTNEVATANGYTQGTKALTSVTWTESSGTITWDSANPVWTASGGSITARFAAIYNDSQAAPVADPIVCHSLLDNAPADVTATDGNTLTVQMNASGIFTVA